METELAINAKRAIERFKPTSNRLAVHAIAIGEYANRAEIMDAV